MKKSLTKAGKLAAYSGMAGAFLAGGHEADAAIQFTDVNFDVPLNSSFNIDFDGDGVFDATVLQISYGYATTYSSNGIVAFNGNGNNFVGYGSTTGFVYASALASGALIGATGTAVPNIFVGASGVFPFATMNYFDSIGQWTAPGTDAFIGMEFLAGDGSTYNAWIRCLVTDQFNVRVVSYAWQDDGSAIAAGDEGTAVCTSANPPANPTHVDGASSVTLNWDPVTNSVACQVRGTRVTPPGPSPSLNIFGTEPSSTVVPYAAAGAGTTWSWEVRCACSISPIDATAFSESDTFNVPTLRIEQEMEAALFPNPASDQVMLGTGIAAERDTEIRIMDLTGRVVDFVILPEDARNIQLDVSALENGMYFVQVGEMEAVALEVMH